MSVGMARFVPLPDYHTHTSRCGHASGSAAEYVRAAHERGLTGIGVCDHLPLAGHRDPELSMDLADLPGYVEEVMELKRAHPGYVFLGIEADYEPESFDETRELLRAFPFDYVVGSVHFLDGWAFDDPRCQDGWTGRDIDEVYRRYFELVAEAAETGAFTILGHLDLVKKFGHRPERPPLEAARSLVERVKRSGVAVEINTAGLRKPVSEVYPDIALLRLLRIAGVPLTFGSDAHTPNDVGRDFDYALRLAHAAGYDRYAAIAPATATACGSSARRLDLRPLPPAPGEANARFDEGPDRGEQA